MTATTTTTTGAPMIVKITASQTAVRLVTLAAFRPSLCPLAQQRFDSSFAAPKGVTPTCAEAQLMMTAEKGSSLRNARCDSGETLRIYVGGQGNKAGSGGFNGGGNGGTWGRWRRRQRCSPWWQRLGESRDRCRRRRRRKHRLSESWNRRCRVA